MSNLESVRKAVAAVADIIEDAARESSPMGIPSGHLYAALMGTGMSLASYQTIIELMVAEGRIIASGDTIKAAPKL